MSKRICILTVLTLCSAVPASAQYRNFGVQCTPGAFQACASVELWNATDAAGQLYLYVRLANVQGTTGFEHLPRSGLAYWSINNLTLANYTPWGPSWGSDASFRSGLFSGFGVLAGDSYLCQLDCVADSGPRVGEYIQAYQQPDGYFTMFDPLRHDSWHLLWGCDGPRPVDGVPGGWSTCNNASATWATNLGDGAAFSLTDFSAVNVEFEVYDDAGYVMTTSCTTGVDCATVAPEPVTLVLVGSGLAGMAGVRARRRRQSEKA